MITILGGDGYVGSAFCAELKARGIPHEVLRRKEVDYTSLPVLQRYLESSRPDFLINCAGFTGRPNVDQCEIFKSDCLFGNAVLPGVIAEACVSVDLPWGHVSSGCIFTGSRADGSGFTEEDAPNFSFRQNNCSFYSGTKALGEEVLAQTENVFVWRMRIPFNHEDGPRNYLSKMMRYPRLLQATNSISHLGDFVNASLACWEQKVPYGIYNVTNPGPVTTKQVVGQLREFGFLNHEAVFFDDEADFMSKAAVAPRSNCVLDVSKLLNAGVKLRSVEEALLDSMEHWIPEAPVS